MNFDEYQAEAVKTVIFSKEVAIPYLVTGLAAEAGEVAGKYAKFLRDNTDETQLNFDMLKELGDVVWMVAVLSHYMGFSLNSVAQMNLEKLISRQKRGTLQGSGDER